MKKTILVNLWKSEYTGQVYEIPVDIDEIPKFGGWTLIGTVEKEIN